MILSDKQALKRCVKQAVRHAPVIETDLRILPGGEADVCADLCGFAARSAEGREGNGLRLLNGRDLPLAAAMDALGLSDLPPEQLRETLSVYTPEAWSREVLDTAGIRKALVRIPLTCREAAHLEDDRLSPLPTVGRDFFRPGKYGTDYRACAEQIRTALRALGTRHLLAEGADPNAMRYCLLPVCEEEGLILHLQATSAEALDAAAELLTEGDRIRLIVSADPPFERALIDRAQNEDRLLVQLSDPEHLPLAFARLGTRFIPYASRAERAEYLLGGWLLARERIWRALTEAYIPMARASCTLTGESVERDVSDLLGGNLLAWESD